jgi:hypothetical protein
MSVVLHPFRHPCPAATSLFCRHLCSAASLFDILIPRRQWCWHMDLPASFAGCRILAVLGVQGFPWRLRFLERAFKVPVIVSSRLAGPNADEMQADWLRGSGIKHSCAEGDHVQLY